MRQCWSKTLQYYPAASPRALRSTPRYCAHSWLRALCCSAEKDPARGMLSNLFGAEWTERLIHEVLFDLPVHLERGNAD